jgi:hypothetical protein
VSRSVHVGFVVDKVTMGQVSLLVLRFSPVTYHLTVALQVYISGGWTTGPLAAQFRDMISPHRHHHHHHVAIKELGHLTHFGLTRPEVSSMVFLGSFCLFGCSFLINLGNLLRGILFTCCIKFLL